MAINSFQELKEYVETLATEHVAVRDFVYGESSRIISRQKSRINYPVVWLLPVEAAPVGGGENARYRYEFTILILTNAAIDDWAKEDNNMYLLEEVAKDFIARLHSDSRENRLFDFELKNTRLDPKHKFSGDNDHGWVIEGSLITWGEYCYNEAKWTGDGE